MNTLLQRLRLPLLAACLVLAALLPLRAENWQTIPFQLAAPERAAHEFGLASSNGGALGTALNNGLVELYGGSSSANGVSLTVTLDVDAGFAFSLWDMTAGERLLVGAYLDAGTWRLLPEGGFLPAPGVPTTVYLLVPEARRDHPLALVQPDGLTYAVSVLAGSPMTYSSPSTGLSRRALSRVALHSSSRRSVRRLARLRN